MRGLPVVRAPSKEVGQPGEPTELKEFLIQRLQNFHSSTSDCAPSKVMYEGGKKRLWFGSVSSVCAPPPAHFQAPIPPGAPASPVRGLNSPLRVASPHLSGSAQALVPPQSPAKKRRARRAKSAEITEAASALASQELLRPFKKPRKPYTRKAAPIAASQVAAAAAAPTPNPGTASDDL